MTKILDDVYYYRHPLNANCVVFAFLTGNGREFDLIDTGISRAGIYRNVIKQMRNDRLEPSNLRNVFHTHYHFDHVQANCLFEKMAKLNKNNVNFYAALPDKYRTLPDYNLINTNMEYLTHFFKRYPTRSFPTMPYLARYGLAPFIKTPIPNNLIFYNDQDELLIGQYKARVYTTGGHTEGHSFFHFPEIGVLHTGDNNALNEMIVDFGAVINSMLICREISPEMIFIGHNEPRKNMEESSKWINSWFDEFDVILNILKPFIKNNVRINITKIMQKMAGWVFKIEVVRFFAFMQLFVILQYLEKKGFGKIELSLDNMVLFFHTSENAEEMELKLEP